MTTTQIPSTSLSTLTPQDLALLELLHTERFNINALINKKNPFHPAQTSILNLLDWVDQPHIDAAIQRIVHRTQSLSAKADHDARLIAKKSLSHALAVAASMIPHFDTCPDDPEQAELFAKHTETLIRETRLIARTLLKLSPPPSSPRRARTATSPECATDDITDLDPNDPQNNPQNQQQIDSGDNTTMNHDSALHADSDLHTSAQISRTSRRDTRISRLNRNSRKPAFSPAEVAEILSALLDHEETHKPLIAPSIPSDPTTPPSTSPSAPSLLADPAHA